MYLLLVSVLTLSNGQLITDSHATRYHSQETCEDIGALAIQDLESDTEQVVLGYTVKCVEDR